MERRSALVVEGGAMRGIFSAGVLDAFIKEDFYPFDLYIGVSAGSTNLAAYLARMYQRNYRVYMDYSVRSDFINWRKFLMGGHLVDLDWLWEITIREMRLDLGRIVKGPGEFYVGVTKVSSGEAVYVNPTVDNLEEVIKASCAIPLFYREFISLAGVDYVDGGLVDPIPVLEAYNRGATDIMVLRSRPKSFNLSDSGGLGTKLMFRRFPGLMTASLNRAKAYQMAIDFMRNPPQGVRVMEVNPPEEFRTGRLTKDKSILEEDYQRGLRAGLECIDAWT